MRAGVLGGLALRVVEVRRHRDHGVRHGLPEVVLRGLLQLLEDHGRDLGRGERLAVDVHDGHAVLALGDLVRDQADLFGHLGATPAHEALDRVDGAEGVRDGLALRDRADQALAVVREGDDGRGGASALFVRDDDRLAALHHRYDRVGRTEIDSDDLARVRHRVDLPPVPRVQWPGENAAKPGTNPAGVKEISGFGDPLGNEPGPVGSQLGSGVARMT